MPARFPAGRALRLLAASLVVTGVLAGPGAAGASGSTCENWTGVPPPNPGTANSLQAVAVVSACGAWAVGYDVSNGAFQTLILHWNGARWRRVASPNPGTDNFLNAVPAASATHVCAVGFHRHRVLRPKTLSAQWPPTVWQQQPPPSPRGDTN